MDTETTPNAWQVQSEAMINLWAEAQRNMWQAWAGMTQAAAEAVGAAEASSVPDATPNGRPETGATPAGAPAGSPGAAATANVVEQWQKLAENAMAAWAAGSEPLVKDVSACLLNSQDFIFRYTRLMTESWQALSAQSTGQDWSKALETYAEQLKRGWSADPTAFAAASGNTTELWRLYLESVGRLMGPWAESLKHAHGHLGGVLTGDRSAFVELSRLYWDAWERTGGRLLESPSLGMTREFEEKLLAGFDAWVDYRRAVLEYQGVVGEAWVDAAVAVMQALKARADDGKPIESLRELTALWTAVTDAAMEQVFRSEPYAAAQGKMLNAAMAYRRAERAIVDTFLKMTDIAARSELDEAFHEIYHLRHELKALRREVEALKAQGGAA